MKHKNTAKNQTREYREEPKNNVRIHNQNRGQWLMNIKKNITDKRSQKQNGLHNKRRVRLLQHKMLEIIILLTFESRNL